MSRIIAGRFETQDAAEAAAAALAQAGFERAEYGSFYLNPPGQHAQYPIGGDAHHDEGTKRSGRRAAVGGAVGGAAGLAAGGIAAAAGEPGYVPAAVIAGAGVGAYVGSLQGALSGTRGGDPAKATPDEPVERPAGVMLVVCVDREGMRATAVEVLRRQGAMDIEEADGVWRDGMWQDFDPTAKPRLVAEARRPS
jgi:hypothetical protein